MKRRNLILLALLVFLVTGILHAPAASLHAWLIPRWPNLPIELQGLSGTIAKGQAAQLALQGRPLVGDVAWDLRALQLLLGRLSFGVSGGGQGTLIDGTAYLLPSGTLGWDGLRLSVPVKSAFAAAGQSFVPVEGQLALNLSRLKLRQRWPVLAEGTLNASGLSWKLGREGVPLGDYEALLETETATGIKASIRTLAGALEVTGDARLDPERRYELHLQMRPKPNAPALLPNLVRSLGQPDAQGWYHLRRTGQVPAPAGTAADELPPEEAPAEEIVE